MRGTYGNGTICQGIESFGSDSNGFADASERETQRAGHPIYQSGQIRTVCDVGRDKIYGLKKNSNRR